MKTEPFKCYILDEDQFAKLKGIEKRLYGDGSILTPDARRDLANYMNWLMCQIEHSKGEFQPDAYSRA